MMLCSSYGQSIVASYAINGEILFSILICSAGLVLFSHLIGNMQVNISFCTVQYWNYQLHVYIYISILIIEKISLLAQFEYRWIFYGPVYLFDSITSKKQKLTSVTLPLSGMA